MRKAAVTLIVNSEGLILGVSRRNDPTKFGLPGGKVEDNETPEEAAARETKEETGINVHSSDNIFLRVEPRHSPEGQDFLTYCYYAITWDGTPQNSEEGVVKWLTAKELIGENGAFAEYNTLTLDAFRAKFPDVFIKLN